MKKLIFALLIIFITSCGNGTSTNPQPTVRVTTENDYTKTLQIYKIDGCEYVAYCLSCDNAVLTHKGDCSNPIHQCKCK